MSGKQLADLKWQAPEESRYLFKRCRFAAIEERPGASRLFLMTNPVGKAGKLKAFLQLWDPQDWTLKKVASCDESLAALAVRDDGRFVAAGTMFSGSVIVYVAFSLQVSSLRSARLIFLIYRGFRKSIM